MESAVGCCVAKVWMVSMSEVRRAPTCQLARATVTLRKCHTIESIVA